MHALPAAQPFPVGGIALAALDDIGGVLGGAVGDQRGEDRGDLVLTFPARLGALEGEALLDEAGVELTAHEAVRVHQRLVEGDIGAHADDAVFLQRAAHAQDGLGARLAPHDQLGDQRVVVGRDLEAGVDAGIDAHARPGRLQDDG